MTGDRAGPRRGMLGFYAGGLGIILLAAAAAALLAAHRRRAEMAGLRHHCAANLRQLALACQMYADDYGGEYPPGIREVYPDYQDIPWNLWCPLTPRKSLPLDELEPGGPGPE